MVVIIIPLALIVFFIFWRFFYFFRDPNRIIPIGENIVSPADGTIIYIKKIIDGKVPISIKKKKEIYLNEIAKTNLVYHPSYLVGIFMHPTDVHVNRSPISGVVSGVFYTKGKNLPMTAMWMRVLMKAKPYEYNSLHILSNERNTVVINGKFPVAVVQIADIYVNKIKCFVTTGDQVMKGERIGQIITGSQVDLIFPVDSDMDIVVNEGQKVKAGQTIIAKPKV